MLSLHPISEQEAEGSIGGVYRDIKKVLDVPSVPLLFQYIANFEAYFAYLWERMKQNLDSDVFPDLFSMTKEYSHLTIAIIYTPSELMRDFVQKLSHAEKHEIRTTITHLEDLNIKLFLLNLGIRESIKGMFQDKQFLPGREISVDADTLFLGGGGREIVHEGSSETALIPAQRMLAPLFGHSLEVIQYPDFYTNVSFEMDKLIETEAYLKTRVELEQLGVKMVTEFPYSFGSSFREIVALTGHNPQFYELLYILKDIFPTQFPRLVLTTAIMEKALR